MIDFTVKLSIEDAKEFIRKTLSRRSQRILLIILISFVFIYASIAAVGPNSFDLKKFILYSSIGIVLVVALRIFQLYSVSKTAKRQFGENAYFKYENHFSFGDKELSYSNEVSSLKMFLEDIGKVLETKNLFIVYFTGTGAVILPKNGIPIELDQWLHERMKNRRK